MGDEAQSPFSLIAAVHTRSSTRPSPTTRFPKRRLHEIRFQDINLAWRGTDRPEPAIERAVEHYDDGGGHRHRCAVRRRPAQHAAGRANYPAEGGTCRSPGQRRRDRRRLWERGQPRRPLLRQAGRDDHRAGHRSTPDLENVDIARRHVRAFIIQRYSEDRIPGVDPLTKREPVLGPREGRRVSRRRGAQPQ